MDIFTTAIMPLFGILILIIGIPLLGFLFGLGFAFAGKVVSNSAEMRDLKSRLKNAGSALMESDKKDTDGPGGEQH